MSTHSLLFIEPMEVAVIGKARLHFKNAFKLQWLVCDMENHANVFASVTSRVSNVDSFISKARKWTSPCNLFNAYKLPTGFYCGR